MNEWYHDPAVLKNVRLSIGGGGGGGGGSILEKNTPFEHQQAETNFREPVKTPCILLKI